MTLHSLHFSFILVSSLKPLRKLVKIFKLSYDYICALSKHNVKWSSFWKCLSIVDNLALVSSLHVDSKYTTTLPDCSHVLVICYSKEHITSIYLPDVLLEYPVSVFLCCVWLQDKKIFWREHVKSKTTKLVFYALFFFSCSWIEPA